MSLKVRMQIECACCDFQAEFWMPVWNGDLGIRSKGLISVLAGRQIFDYRGPQEKLKEHGIANPCPLICGKCWARLGFKDNDDGGLT